jgi:hypothetical protein
MLVGAAKDEERKCEENQYVKRVHCSSIFLIICMLYLYNAILELCYLAALTLINYSIHSVTGKKKILLPPSTQPKSYYVSLFLVFTK